MTSNVHDTQTTTNDPNLLPFRTAVNNRARRVMASSAYYDRIDARPGTLGAFSNVVMGTTLRSNAHFTGVIISDDLCNAAQLFPWSGAVRAENVANAGGAMVLCGNTNAIPYIYNGIVQLARRRPDFLAKVNAAVLAILAVKHGQQGGPAVAHRIPGQAGGAELHRLEP